MEDHRVSFLIFNHPNGDKTYELTLTIPQTLYQYYTQKSHYVFSSRDFSKFVTPQTFQQVADTLWQLYDNPEDFTNAVLTMVHQITYEETIPSFYPVETLVRGKGDCDLFVYIASSILEAGGINTVLLFYETQAHMQLGVDIGYLPVDARSEAVYVTYQNVPYYIAECTGSAWRTGWRVGECSTIYQNASVQVTPLIGMEKTSIGQISTNIRELDSSTITLQISPSIMLENTELAISGQILPLTPNENVTIRAQIPNQGWVTVAIIPTQQDGRFNCTWTPLSVGPIELQASWIGNNQYNGATSSSYNIVILPLYFIALLIVAVIIALMFVVVIIKLRHRKSQLPPEVNEPKSQIIPTPEIPQETHDTINTSLENTTNFCDTEETPAENFLDNEEAPNQ
ncbi:MAG: hypothetical protein LBH79_06735 [Nitrososphaerota archaeon]|nr:hypothetical protein [Nitrososphaerota archaeon]